MAYWHDRTATGAAAPRYTTSLLLCLLTALLRVTHALQSVPGSPCEDVCSAAGNLADDVVCLDASYQSLAPARAFQNCVACQLNSTAVDTANNYTDVAWGLSMTLLSNRRKIMLKNCVQRPFVSRSPAACLPSRRTTYPSAAPVKSAVRL
jgi:hypothetical protein